MPSCPVSSSHPHKHLSIHPRFQPGNLYPQLHQRRFCARNRLKQSVTPDKAPSANRKPTLRAAKHRAAPRALAPFARLAGAQERRERTLMKGARREGLERHEGYAAQPKAHIKR